MNVERVRPICRQVRQNTDLSAQLQHRLPAAQASFRLWHIGDLYLEVLIERGLWGLLLFWTMAWVLSNLWSASLSQEAGGRVLFAFLLGKAALGFVISVHEVLCMTLIRWLLEWSMQSCSGQNRDAY